MDQELRLLFHELADLSPAERASILNERQVAPGIRAELESLLAADSDDEHPLTECVSDAAADVLSASREDLLLTGADAQPGAAGKLLSCQPGVVLDGKYRIERQLGKGGMGAVFQAIHLGTTRTVAVKVIVPQLAGDEEFLIRFRREAEASGRLRHPNVVNVTDFGSALMDDGQLAYLVMEFLDGQNLSDFLKKNPKPASDEILDIVDQIALALDAAHESGIVHRDLKPDNIWLQPNHRGGFNVKVLDFGIAKLNNPVGMGSADVANTLSTGFATGGAPLELETLLMGPADSEPGDQAIMPTPASIRPAAQSGRAGLRLTNDGTLQTRIGSLLGTPAYMAPEQCQGGNVDASADIYALSVIVYQMLCGCLPFEAKSLSELLEKQLEELPRPPSDLDAGISQRVSEAVMSGLAKAPAARPPSATALAAQLRAGSEAEIKPLADGRLVASNYVRCFFPMALACFAPQIPIVSALYLVERALSRMAIVPAGVLVIAFPFLLLAVQFFLSQMYKAGSALLLSEAAAAGHFQQQWRPAFWKLVRGLPSLVSTHLRSTFDLRPRSFLSNHLWPVVWVLEGLSGKPALARALRLAKAEPQATIALAARQWAILSATALLIPVVASGIPAFRGGGYVRLLTGPSNSYTTVLGIFVHYPMFVSVMIFRLVGPASFFLYLSARRCLGEAVQFSLPSVSRGERSRRAASMRPATIAWLSLPALMAAVLLYRAFF